jgi:hypothetical protein
MCAVSGYVWRHPLVRRSGSGQYRGRRCGAASFVDGSVKYVHECRKFVFTPRMAAASRTATGWSLIPTGTPSGLQSPILLFTL